MHVDAVNGLAIWHSHPDTCINNIEKIRLFWWIDVDKKVDGDEKKEEEYTVMLMKESK